MRRKNWLVGATQTVTWMALALAIAISPAAAQGTQIPASAPPLRLSEGSATADYVWPQTQGCDDTLGSIGDTVWYDNDGDGVQDADEPGIPDVTVYLNDPGLDDICGTGDEEFIASDVTDADGLYLFDGLTACTYCIEIDKATLPDNVQQTYEKDGTLDGVTRQPLDTGEDVLDVDFGCQPLGSIGDTVWTDDDGDGVQDVGEPGIPNVTVDLNDAGPDGTCGTGDDTFIASDVTDANGTYLFSDLPEGTYCVDPDETTVPDGYGLTTANDPETVNLGPGEDYLDADFGYQPLPATVGDRVWTDDDGDGVQDVGEPGIPDVTVNLTDCAGDILATDVTDAGGLYLFDGLAAGTYCVEIDEATLPDNVQQTYEKDGTLDGDTQQPLNAGDEVLDVDFGYQPRYTLGDRVWYDQDQDGIQDANEPGYNGATVDLHNNATCSGAPIAGTTTGAVGPDGFYEFTDLPAGDYCVQFGNIPAGWNISPQDQGANDTLDSDADGDARITNIVLTADDPDEDMGIYESGSIGDQVWCESTTNANTSYDPADGDFGLPAIGVTLYADIDCDGVADGAALATLDSDGTGFYTFSGLQVALAGDAANQTCYVTVVDAADPDLGACNRPITPAESSSDLDSDVPDDPDSDFGFEQLICNLAVNKSCQVTPPTTIDFVCSDAKPIDELTMIWNDAQDVRIKAWKGSVGSTLLADIDQIVTGQKVTVSGYAGSPNDVVWEILVAGSSTKIGESMFHLSCSDAEMNGPEDCGLPEGDGKGNDTSLINDWLFEGLVGENGMALICTPEPPQPSESCEITLGPTPSCETAGDPYELTFRFAGGTCADSDNDQGDKFKCTDYGTIDPTQPVQVIYVGKDPAKFTVAPDLVSVGDEFTIDTTRADFHAETKLEIRQNGTLMQFLNIHTSCSAPLAVGDLFASLELVAFNGATGGNEVTYLYQVTNLGDALSGVTLFDIPLGEIDTGGPFSLATGETRTFQTVAEINETITNEGIFGGFLANGAVCSASDFATVTVVEPCAECKGGTTELTFQYLGTQAANVVAYDDKDAKADKILFQGLLQPGDEFTITPRPGQNDLNNDVSIWVEGVFNAKIHTSCSQPIGPGMIVGDFEVVSGRSKDNGLICPLDACAPQPASQIEFHDREIKWDITNNGDLGLEIERIILSWPAANGALDEIKRDGDTIHKGDFGPPSAVIDSGWEGNADKRTIKPGETDTLKLKFKNNADTQGEYHIIVEFTAGCTVEIEYVPGQESLPQICTSKIQAMSLSYTGPDLVDPTTVELDPDKGATVTYDLPGGLASGTLLSMASQNDWTIDATASGESELGAKTKIRINGVEQVIHTSCSTPFVAGAPAPLDNPKGAPSPNWFVESFRQK